MSSIINTEIVRITTIDPLTGDELQSYYGVLAGDDQGYAITRSAESLDELRDDVGDLEDTESLVAHVVDHHEHMDYLQL